MYPFIHEIPTFDLLDSLEMIAILLVLAFFSTGDFGETGMVCASTFNVSPPFTGGFSLGVELATEMGGS